MATSLFRSIRRASSVLRFSYSTTSFSVSPRSVVRARISVFLPFRQCNSLGKPSLWCGFRELSYGTVNLVITEGKTKFETHEVEPPRKDKYKTKKKLKMQRKREKEKRKAANRRDPRRLGVKGKKKQKFANAEERIKCKLEKARIKESMLIERLKRYDIPKAQGPVAKPDDLTGEERFYLKKMAQKGTNYLQVGRRGLFGGVILNMHMHWKKHETVKVICKPCKPGQVHDYAQELARLSGGIPIHIIGDDTIIFYRGKNYEQPEVMSPVDTLSKKKALEKSKYEQSLESVRRFITIAEKELELYYRHIALYGDPNNRNPLSVLDGPSGDSMRKGYHHRIHKQSNPELSSDDADSKEMGLSEAEDNHFEDENLTMDESDSEEDSMLYSSDDDKQREEYFSNLEDGSASSSSTAGSSPSMYKHTHHYSNNDNQCLLSKQMP